jgi:hypothetical protein
MTPLQELLNYVDAELKLDGYEHKIIMEKILSLKEKERIMVEMAWEDGKYTEAGLSHRLNGYEFYNDYITKKNNNCDIKRN